MFTQEQINTLLTNKNVSKCSAKSITYNPTFKLKAVKKYFEEGLSPGLIFEQAGFNPNLINRNKAEDRLKAWRSIYKCHGEKGLLRERRGGQGGRPPKVRFKNDKEKIKYLEAKIAYIKAENDFLAKLRGLKGE